jgi:hypothetical protein
MNIGTFEIVGKGLVKIVRFTSVAKKNQIHTITSETIPKSSHNSLTVWCLTTSSVKLRVRGNLKRSPSRSVLCP